MKKAKATPVSAEVVQLPAAIHDNLATQGMVIDVAIGERVEELKALLTQKRNEYDKLNQETYQASGKIREKIAAAVSAHVTGIYEKSEVSKIVPVCFHVIDVDDNYNTAHGMYIPAALAGKTSGRRGRGMRMMHGPWDMILEEMGGGGLIEVAIPKSIVDNDTDIKKHTDMVAQQRDIKKQITAIDKDLEAAKNMRGKLDVTFKARMLEDNADTRVLLEEARAALPKHSKEVKKLLTEG